MPYGAYRAQHERSILVRRMAEQARRKGGSVGSRLEKRAERYEEGAELLRRLIATAMAAARYKTARPEPLGRHGS